MTHAAEDGTAPPALGGHMPHAFTLYLLVSVLLALAPPPALREPLEEEEPSESEEELLMLSLS